MLDLDPGARRLGEIGLGLNPGINRFTGEHPLRREDRRDRPRGPGPKLPRDGRHERIGTALGPDHRHPNRGAGSRRMAEW